MATAVVDLDWSDLPEDLLLVVFRRLPIPDLLRSASVCAAWSSAVRELRRHPSPLLHRAPWLMLQYIVDGRDNISFYSLSDWRFYSVPLAYSPLSGRVVGSSYGWLILADERSDLYLLNPITGAQIHDLPPIANLDFVEAIYEEGGTLVGYEVVVDGERNYFEAHELWEIYDKAILSSSPSHGDYAIMVATNFYTSLLLARPGAEDWTAIVTHLYCQDIAFCNQEFYLVTCSGRVRVFDINGNQKASFLPLQIPTWLDQQTDYVQFFVPCPFGEVFVFTRVGMDSNYFLMCRMKGPGGEKMVELKSLGNCALIVGYGDSMCLSCTEYPELRPNCIYINQRFLGVFRIYDIKTGSICFNFCVDPGKRWLLPTWIIPSL